MQKGSTPSAAYSMLDKGEITVEGFLALLWFLARFLLWISLVAGLAWLAGLLVRWLHNR